MARLSDFDELGRDYYESMEMPTFASTPWTCSEAARHHLDCRSATAGDRPFSVDFGDYRLLPGDLKAADLVMSHISTNFDRSGFQQDHNVVFPHRSPQRTGR